MKKWILIIFGIVVVLGGFILDDAVRFHDGKLHVIFCGVGQGDATFIRTPKGKNILIDGGPDGSVLDCLSKHMPFWERTIHELILTHPHQDHFFGMHYVIDRYSVLSFDTEHLENDTAEFKNFQQKLKTKKIPIRDLFTGDELRIKDGVRFIVIGPSAKYLQRTSPHGVIGESGEFASLILQVSYGTFDLLITGDSQAVGILENRRFLPEEIDVLQVPHHGSKSGLDRVVLDILQPVIATISVRKNKYGHPHQTILNLLEKRKIKVLRTDIYGDVEIITDGKQFGFVNLNAPNLY